MRKFAVAIAAAVAAASGGTGCSKKADPPPAAGAAVTAATGDDGAGSGKGRKAKHEDRHDPAIAAPVLQIAVAVDGAAASWGPEAFAKVDQFTGNTKANDGEAREVWSLRELAHTLVGPTARVTVITGDGGSQSIDRAAWDDASRTPLLHTTRRGTLKFRWADAKGAWGDTEIKDVTRIELAK